MSETQPEAEAKPQKKIFPAVMNKTSVHVKNGTEVNVLLDRGYGEKEEGKINLAPFEALYLLSEGLIEVVDREKNGKLDFQEVLRLFMAADSQTWTRYLIYRDLRQRGYVVKAGFGIGVDFRVYERGTYGLKAAKYMVYAVMEGEPMQTERLLEAVEAAQNSKKEMILAVVERRGEVVYYSLSQFLA